MEIKAKETYYRGIKYRSRIEARWSVFFDVMGIEKYYEPEKFDLGGGVAYIPDFFLPKLPRWHEEGGVYFEVKGAEPSIEEIEKVYRLGKLTGRDAVLFYGSNFDTGLESYGVPDRVYRCQPMQCPFCGGLGFTNSILPETEEEWSIYNVPHLFNHSCLPQESLAEAYDIDECFMDFTLPNRGEIDKRIPITHHSPALDIAYSVAKSARFEDPNFEIQVQTAGACVSQLTALKVFALPEVYRAIGDYARRFNLDPNCPRYTNWREQRREREAQCR